jgi:hypothetical protein
MSSLSGKQAHAAAVAETDTTLCKPRTIPMKKILPISILGLALVAFMNSAAAANITVGNFSFEDPVITNADPGPGDYIVTTSIPDWTFIDNNIGTGVQLTSAAYATPGDSDQLNHAWMNILGSSSAVSTLTYSGTGLDALPGILPGANYELTVAVGNRDSGSGGIGGVETVGLEAAGVALPYATLTLSETSLPVGTFTDVHVYLTASEIATYGLATKQLGIQLTGASVSTDYFDQPAFDNVVLTIPEPSTWALMGFGGLVFLWALNRMKNRA